MVFGNAAAYCRSKGPSVDRIIMEGDVVAKMIVPIVKQSGHSRAHLIGTDHDRTPS